MDKELIIRKLKENKKLLLICSIIFTSGIILGFSLSTINFSKPKKYYVALDDIGISGNSDPFGTGIKITYDDNNVIFRWGDSSSTTGFIMRFDLRNKPKKWSKCEISLYVYNKVRDSGSAQIYLFSGNWTEEEWDGYGNYMRDFEIYWKIEEPVGSVSNGEIGFSIIDITDYIGNITTATFSIAVLPNREFDGIGYIFSSEWNNTDPIFPYGTLEGDSYKNYLPQLIWG